MSDPTTDNYQNWMSQLEAGQKPKDIAEGERVLSSAGEPFGVIEFARTERDKYIGEVGKKSGDYIFHFYPINGKWLPDYPTFEEKMGEAFLEVFKLSERVEAVFSPELNSWAVRARGFAHNPLADELALRVFTVLDKNLE